MAVKTLDLFQMMGYGYDTGSYVNSFLNPCRYQLWVGGRNTKKSTNKEGIELVFKLMTNPLRNALVVRKNDSDNRQTTIANLWNVITDIMGLGDYWKRMTNPRQIVYRKTGQAIVFKGFNNPTGIAGTKFDHGLLTDIVIDEASEITDYDEFRKLDGSLRGEMPDGLKMQITLLMNPWNRQHWIHDVMYQGRMDCTFEEMEKNAYMDCYDPAFQLGFGKGLYIHQSTFRVNEFRSADYDEGMEYLRDHAPDIYKTEGLGMWGNSTLLVYPEFARANNVISVEEMMKTRIRAFAIGIDTGYSRGPARKDGRVKSATVMEMVGITPDCSKLISIDEWYHSNNGDENPMLMHEEVRACVSMIREWRDRIWREHPDLFYCQGVVPVYVDSADKPFVEEFNLECGRQGMSRWCKATWSTKMTIQTRVDFARYLIGYQEFLICSKCQNLIREIEMSRRGAHGECRENLNDHALNAWEYGWTPLKAVLLRWKKFKER